MVTLMKAINVLEYKGYYTKVEYSAPDKVLFGKIEGIRDLVNFEADTPDDVEREFRLAVDDYLASCADDGEEPDKPYKGMFNVRIPPELHRDAAMTADKQGTNLNAFVTEAIKEKLAKKKEKTASSVNVFLPYERTFAPGIFMPMWSSGEKSIQSYEKEILPEKEWIFQNKCNFAEVAM